MTERGFGVFAESSHQNGQAAQPLIVTIGALVVDLASGWVTLHGQRVDLTAQEYKLIACLAGKPGCVIPAAKLLQNVWGCAENDDKNSKKKLKDSVWRLRQKIEPDPANPIYIITARGRGYYMPTHVDDPPTETTSTAAPFMGLPDI